MAARFDGSTGMLSRTAGMPTITNFTISFWFYVTADQDCMMVALADASPDSVAGIHWQDVGSGGNLTVISITGGGATINEIGFASRPAVGTWNFAYIQCSGSGASLLTAGWAGITSTSFVTAATTLTASPTITALNIGVDTYGDYFSGRLQNVVIHDAVLSTAELLAQKAQHFPARWANLNSWYPMIAASVTNIGIDYGGNGRSLTTTGTVTIEDPPPLVWGMGSVVTSGPLATGTTFNQSALASTSPVVSRGLQTGKLLVANNAPPAALVRSITKTLKATTTPAPAAGRQWPQVLLANTTPVGSIVAVKVRLVSALVNNTPIAALVRLINKPLTVSATPPASIVKTTAKTLQVATTPTKTFGGIRVVLRSLLVSTTPVTSVTKQTGKPLLVTNTPVARLIRSIAKFLRITTTPVASKGTGRTKLLLASTSPIASALAAFVLKLRGRTIAQTITATGVDQTTTITGLTGATRSTELP